eukprot:Gb_23855 [translate_table: standard]
MAQSSYNSNKRNRRNYYSYCGKLGHSEDVYFKKKRYMSYENKDGRHRGNYAGRGRDENNEDGELDVVFMATSTSCSQKSSGIWYLDSGATKHMTGRKEWCSKLVECANESIALGDNKVYKAKGIVRVPLKMADK